MTEQELNELRTRQEEAKRRVLEMQSRSRFAAEQMNRSLGVPAKQERQGPEPVPAAKNNGFQHLCPEELERLFILSLCLLLSHENADQSVILGLMYLLT